MVATRIISSNNFNIYILHFEVMLDFQRMLESDRYSNFEQKIIINYLKYLICNSKCVSVLLFLVLCLLNFCLSFLFLIFIFF